MNIAIIGGGISGIASAIILKKAGYQVTLFEKAPKIGGIWAVAYKHVQLQNIWSQYHFSDFPWPKKPNLHPSGEEIREYLEAAVEHFQLDLRLGHEIQQLEELEHGWTLHVKNRDGVESIQADFVISSIGQYTEGKHRPEFEGENLYQGRIVTERDFKGPELFEGKKVAVVGFGKSALDMATFSGHSAELVHHVFRTPRWTIPYDILGVHYSNALFNRLGTALMTSWAYPTKAERFVNENLSFIGESFWSGLSLLVEGLAKSKGWFADEEGKKRLEKIIPKHKFVNDLRSATAMLPISYLDLLVSGKIEPHQAEVTGFTEKGLKLSNGEEVEADLVVLSVGSKKPSFPFLPQQYRNLVEKEHDGVQLYRHILHPDIPNFAFSGYNHGFMHIPAVEVAAVWLHAMLSGDLILPSKAEMHRQIEEVQEWKRKNIHFEPSRLCAVSTRFQQYLDIMLNELEVSPYRKSNPISEILSKYEVADYKGVLEEYEQSKGKRSLPLKSLQIAT